MAKAEDVDADVSNTTRSAKYSGPVYFYPFCFADRSDWILYGIGTFTAIVSGGCFPVLDLLYGIWTTAIVQGDSVSFLRNKTNLVAGICMGIGVLQCAVTCVFLCCFSIASSRMTDRLRREYLSSVIHQDSEFFERVGPGEVGTRMLKDIGSVRSGVGEKLSILIWSMSTLVVALIMAFVRSARLAGVVFSIIPFSFILFALVSGLSSKAESRLLVVEGQAGTLLEQILSSVRVVQSFAAETFLAKKYDAYLQQLQKLAKWRSIVRVWYGSRLVVGDNLEVGIMFTVFWNIFNALFSIVAILPHVLAIKDSIKITARLLEDIERVPKIDICRTDGDKLWGDEKANAEIALRNVTFSYPSRPDHKSLDGVDLIFEGGKVTALVGASGSGKSTIASLLLWYYDPSAEDDQVLLADRDIRSLNLSWLRSQTSLVSQEPQLFTTSIFENVAYGLTGTPFELPSDFSAPEHATRLNDVRGRVERALRQAQAWEFVCNLPEGMDTRVSGARTGVLSGGQRQRIAAARALIRRPKILLLDEGTSALDSETEQKLMAAIHEEQEKTGMTTILIAHRLSSIQNADRIIVMSNGRVVEHGAYAELIALGGVFSGLVKHQISAAQPVEEKDTLNASSRELFHQPTPEFAKSRPNSGASTASLQAQDLLERGALGGKKPDALTTRFIKLLARSGGWIMGGIFGGICVGAAYPICAWLIGFVIQTFAIQDDNNRLLSEARRWAMWFLILAIIDAISSAAAGFFLSAGADRIDRRLKLVALSSILKQEIGFFDREENASGALTAALAAQTNNVTVAIGLIWQQLISAVANFIGTAVLGIVLSWRLSLVGLSPVPFILAAAYFNIVYIEKYERQVQKPLEEASGFASENVDSIKTVAALGREEAVMQQFDKSASKYIAKVRDLAVAAVGFGVGVGSFLTLSAMVMWWGTALYTRGKISLQNLYACFDAIIITGYAASRLFTFIPDWAKMVHGFRRVCEWEDRHPEVAALKLVKPESEALKDIEGEIVFDVCTLKYASRPKPAITDMSFTIKAGQSVAFCGPSGGGKSSIISMISRFYDPSTGTILLDGRDIRSIPLNEYRSYIALVSQDAVLYEGTFRENITLGETSITQEQLEKACRDASILEFIQSLPQGFDTNVGFKGSQMSGGQKQRICIARALLRNPRILLLDEATSALDAESERSVKEALEHASIGRTTISIAHRLSTIQGADVIHVIEDGRIIESGSHAQLVALDGRYVDLVRSQL